MIYLASPYSAETPELMQRRYEQVLDYTATKINHGVVVYSPIVHNHPIVVKWGLPTDWEFWKKFDAEMICGADELWVLKLPGWDQSKGVAAEVAIAIDLDIPVTYIDWTK